MAVITCDELRRSFDSAFAAPLPERAERVDLIALRAGGLSCAVRIAEIGGVVPLPGLAPLPCEEPALMGLAAVRGAVLPVYDLSALAGGGAAGAPRWALVTVGANRVALAFDEIEEYLRVGRDQLVATSAPGSPEAPAVSEAVRHGSALRAVVSVASVLKHIEERLGVSEPRPSRKER